MSMALRTARSTPAQRLALLRVQDDLQAVLASAPVRFFLTDEQSRAYVMVLRHLERWTHHEIEQKEENHD